MDKVIISSEPIKLSLDPLIMSTSMLNESFKAATLAMAGFSKQTPSAPPREDSRVKDKRRKASKLARETRKRNRRNK